MEIVAADPVTPARVSLWTSSVCPGLNRLPFLSSPLNNLLLLTAAVSMLVCCSFWKPWITLDFPSYLSLCVCVSEFSLLSETTAPDLVQLSKTSRTLQKPPNFFSPSGLLPPFFWDFQGHVIDRLPVSFISLTLCLNFCTVFFSVYFS